MTSRSLSKCAVALLLGIGIHTAQAQENNRILQVPETASQEELMAWKQTLPTDGWFLLHFREGDRLYNYTNKDYELSMWFNCSGSGKPGYLVEYSDNYRDGDFGGIDFVSSGRDNGNRVQFTLDGKDFGDPFAKGNPQLPAFTAALKKANKLTIMVFDSERNPATNKEEEKLNRSIDFKLAHGELLDKPVSCGG